MSELDPGTVRKGFRILGEAIRSEPRPFAIAASGAALYAVMTIASAIVLGQVTDRVIVPAFEEGRVSAGLLAAAAAAIVGVAILKACGIIVRRAGAGYLQAKLQATYRRRVTEQYQRLPLAWHRRHSTGELLSNANADVEAAFWPIAPLPLSAGVVLMLLMAAVVMVATDLVLALIGFLVGPALAAVNWVYNRRMQGPSTRAQELRAKVSDVAHESFDGALVVKTLGREREETARFQAAAEELRDELIVVGRLRGLFDPLMEALPSAGILLVLLAGAWRFADGHVTEGEVVLIAYLFTLLSFPLRAIGYLLSEFPRAVVGWERIHRVLEATDELAYGETGGEGDGGPAEVDLVEVAFAYEQEPVLRDVTFRAPPGLTIAVVGPTGAGKSTIASLLVRLSDPVRGEVRLDGADLRSLTRGAVAGQVAIVFQESFLFDDTVRENITLGEPFTDEEVREAARLAQAHGFIEQMPQEYETLVGERGTTLSGGQRQRVALARALVRRPRLLVLDDATSSVDPAVERTILLGMKRADLPSTIVVVAYRAATIALADEIIFVEGGLIRARGTHRELIESVPGYARLLRAYEAGMR